MVLLQRNDIFGENPDNHLTNYILIMSNKSLGLDKFINDHKKYALIT